MEKYEEFARDFLRDLNCVKNFLLDRASVFGVSEWVLFSKFIAKKFSIVFLDSLSSERRGP